jgi:hypothetical protein
LLARALVAVAVISVAPPMNIAAPNKNIITRRERGDAGIKSLLHSNG